MQKEIKEALQKPFPASEIKLKVQAKLKNDPNKGIIVAYIDARNVMERLDEVGVEWSDYYREVNLGDKTGIECTLIIDGVTRTDIGDPASDGMDDSLKSAYSDAFKRAAVKFGIGRFLYALPKMYAELDGNYIKKDELAKLKNVIQNHLAQLGVTDVMKSDSEIVVETKERVWSLEVLDAVISANVGATNHEEATEILSYSTLSDTATVKTVQSWLKHYSTAGKDTILGCADVANQAYAKAKKGSK